MLDTQEVTGSHPVSPTVDDKALTCGNASQGLRRTVAEVTASCPMLDSLLDSTVKQARCPMDLHGAVDLHERVATFATREEVKAL